ncbi:hypothetical protein SAMN05421780_10612 [Flexibacter flexilis DSM 6793]|uniref:Lipoprotein n=1 Tax=Flexibacter flexilis DSM 6793 TaxID=927664 RepID=A0A1I1JJP3_9BACT|nr:hypothetical protein [Flexibacter flexilis]SFC48391.1 hypothetical protein SAMN05421780_10612 [Flexibacter flexilis DSM 6793]
MIKPTVKWFAVVAIAATFSACGDSATKSAETTTPTDTASQAATYEKNVETVIDELPTASEIPALLESTGAEYNATLANPLSKESSYTTTTGKAALNLGVYAADLSYLCVYDKAQDALSYIKTAQKLAQHIGVVTPNVEAVQKRVESNLSNKDSLISIVNQTIAVSDKYLKENQQHNVAALVVVGGFVEGLYVATSVAEKYPKDLPKEVRSGVLTQLVRTVADQEKPLADLVKLLGTVPASAEIDDLKKQLEELQQAYTSLNLSQKIKENKGDMVLDDTTIAPIAAKVKEIRNKIVS